MSCLAPVTSFELSIGSCCTLFSFLHSFRPKDIYIYIYDFAVPLDVINRELRYQTMVQASVVWHML